MITEEIIISFMLSILYILIMILSTAGLKIVCMIDVYGWKKTKEILRR